MSDSISSMVRLAWTPLAVVLLVVPLTVSAQPDPLVVRSPNGTLLVSVGVGAGLTWSVSDGGRTILEPSRLSMTFDAGRVVVRIKRDAIRDHFNERRIDFAGGRFSGLPVLVEIPDGPRVAITEAGDFMQREDQWMVNFYERVAREAARRKLLVDFRPVFNRPASQGTRCHQFAMYVVYESPLQLLADTPSNYRREADALAWLSALPTVWDETRVLAAELGQFIVVARRRGEKWWVGYAREARTVSSADRLPIHLAPGGGWTARVAGAGVPR